MLERYLLWFCPVKKRWKTSWIRRPQPPEGGCHASNSSRFSSFFPRICLIFPNLVKLSEISRYHFHRPSYLYRTGEFQFCRFYIFRTIEQRLIDPEKILKFSILLIFLKTQFEWSWGVRKTFDMSPWPPCRELFYWYVWMTHLSKFLSYGQKWIFRANSIDFWAPTAVLGKVNFFKIALINPFMNRFQNGLLIQRGHVTSEISHNSDIDI